MWTFCAFGFALMLEWSKMAFCENNYKLYFPLVDLFFICTAHFFYFYIFFFDVAKHLIKQIRRSNYLGLFFKTISFWMPFDSTKRIGLLCQLPYFFLSNIIFCEIFCLFGNDELLIIFTSFYNLMLFYKFII